MKPNYPVPQVGESEEVGPEPANRGSQEATPGAEPSALGQPGHRRLFLNPGEDPAAYDAAVARAARENDLLLLLARVEKAEGPADRSTLEGNLDDRIWRWVNDNKLNPHAPGWEYDLEEAPFYTSSLDAALSLVERVLPGWGWEGGSEGDGAYGWVYPATKYLPQGYPSASEAKTPALALLAAMLKALIAKGSEQ